MTLLNEKQKKHFNGKKYFIIKKYVGYQTERYDIHDETMYDIETAMRKLLALDTLNEDKKRTSYHLQEVDLTITDVPLVLTDEVKEDSEGNQEDLLF